MTYKVYFEIFGKKMVKQVDADSVYGAIRKIESEKFIIHKTEEVENVAPNPDEDMLGFIKDFLGIK